MKPASPAGDRYRFDRVQMALHWLTFLFVVTLFLLAQTWKFLPQGGALRHALQALHISFGLLFTAVLAVRLLWRFGLAQHPLPVTRGLVRLASDGMHHLLYLLLVAQVALGLVWGWASTEGLRLFGLLIPPPMTLTTDQRHFVGSLHGTVASVIIILAGLHAVAALFHQFVLRDGLLWRIVPGRGAPQPAAPQEHAD